MLFRKKNKINVFSDGSLNYSNNFFSLKSQINFFDNHFQNIKIFKKNLGKIEKQEGLKFTYRKTFFKF
jgi:hypothetical protein